MSEETPAPKNFKGFGPPPKPSTPAKAKKKNDYGKKEMEDYLAEKGDASSFSIFVRTSPTERWVPAGTIAAPAEKIDEAIDDSHKTLADYALKRFPKLRGQEATFEYGYRPLDKPREPIVAAKVVKKSILDRVKGFFKR